MVPFLSLNLAQRWVTLACLPALVLVSCNYKTSKVVGTADETGRAQETETALSFDSLSRGILNSKCFICHDGARSKDLRSYANFAAVLPGIRARILSDGADHMPVYGSPQLKSAEVARLVSWIDHGSPESEAPVSPLPKPVAAGYEELKLKVLNAKCITCHSGTDPIGDSDDLSTYDGAFAFKGSIRKRVLAPIDSPLHMPPLGADDKPIPDRPQLTDEEIRAIVDWTNAGGPR